MVGHILALRSCVAILTTLSFVANSENASAGVDGTTRAIQEEAIREAVLRYQMEEWARNDACNEGAAQRRQESAEAKQMLHRVFFVSINGKDPSDAFMKRFQNFPRGVKKRSGALLPPPTGGWVEDRETHLPAVMFSADEIYLTSSSDVEARGGWRCGISCGQLDSFIVHEEGGK